MFDKLFKENVSVISKFCEYTSIMLQEKLKIYKLEIKEIQDYEKKIALVFDNYKELHLLLNILYKNNKFQCLNEFKNLQHKEVLNYI